MMLKIIFTALLSLFEKLPVLETPDLLEQFGTVYEIFLGVFKAGLELCIMFMGESAVRFLGIYLGIIILLDAFYLAYQSIWWFLTKIPMLDIKP